MLDFANVKYVRTEEGVANKITDKNGKVLFENKNIIPEKKTLEECSWEEIEIIGELGYVGEKGSWCIQRDGVEEEWFKIRDKKKIELNDGRMIEVEIIDFLHDVAPDGEPIPFTFCFTSLNGDSEQFFETLEDVRLGWKESHFRKEYLPRFTNLLPEDLLNLIKITEKKYVLRNSTNTTHDKLFLLSFSEVNPYAEEEYFEGKTYPVFSNDQSRIKYSEGKPFPWLLRTCSLTEEDLIIIVASRGYCLRDTTLASYGVCLGFCV